MAPLLITAPLFPQVRPDYRVKNNTSPSSCTRFSLCHSMRNAKEECVWDKPGLACLYLCPFNIIYCLLWHLCCHCVADNNEKISALCYECDIQKHCLLVYFLKLIWLPGTIEPEDSLRYRFGLGHFSLACFTGTSNAVLYCWFSEMYGLCELSRFGQNNGI